MPIRIVNNPRDSNTLFIYVIGEHWKRIGEYIGALPNSRWNAEKEYWKTPIDNIAPIREWMIANLPGEKRFCSEECTELIRAYFARLEQLKKIKQSADLDLTAIYHLLKLEAFTKTGGQPGEYQKIGAAWLAAIQRGVLADAYGVGKTVQGIMAALILKHRKIIDQVLIIGTKAASEVWENEIRKFTYEKPLRVRGANRWTQYGERFFTISTYAKISAPTQRVGERESDFQERLNNSDYGAAYTMARTGRCLIIFDEMHKCAKRTAKRTQACKEIAHQAKCRFGISADGGFQNDGQDLFNTYAMIDKNILGNWEVFKKQCLRSKYMGGFEVTPEGEAWIAMRTSTFMLRRTRDQIGIERKDIQKQLLFVEFSDEERNIYDRADAGEFSKDIKGNTQECRLVDITRMRQCCLTPHIISSSFPKISCKLDKVEDIVDELIADGSKVIIYSAFDAWFPMVVERLGHHGIAVFNGQTRNLKALEAKFNSDPTLNIALITDAGAESLSFPSANVTIKLTIPWNISKDGQTDGRMDRMTQEKDMLSITVVVKNTYEESRQLEILDTKAESFDNTVNAAGEMGMQRNAPTTKEY